MLTKLGRANNQQLRRIHLQRDHERAPQWHDIPAGTYRPLFLTDEFVTSTLRSDIWVVVSFGWTEPPHHRPGLESGGGSLKNETATDHSNFGTDICI